MNAWQKAFHEGLVPLLSTEQLEVLLKGLEENDSRLVQGVTTIPPPLRCIEDWPVEACCLITYPYVQTHGGFNKATVGDTEEWFARTCYEMDMILGISGGCRALLNPFDAWERKEMIANLLPEVKQAIQRRTSHNAN